MHASRRTATFVRLAAARGFTIVELLVVMSILVLLVSILMPALNKHREITRRVVCGSNQRQIFVTSMAYAGDFARWLPPGSRAYESGNQSNLFRNNNNWDLRKEVGDYVGSWAVWVCPASEAAPLDDPRNTRGQCYFNYRYFVGRQWPTMDGQRSPERISQPHATAKRTMLQDLMCDWFNADRVEYYRFNYNHGDGIAGEWFDNSADVNPSNFTKTSYSNENDKYTFGANLLFYDGHVAWLNYGDADLLGWSNSLKRGRDFGQMP
ncbi:MAG: prepilin-type N-terminal cleavage/methylation domain-containing protein [Phycisphaera sp.]|nr:prepilin-type N-terminal cleavage/methylation domain-containing protein [Phycisphaera sp.]